MIFLTCQDFNIFGMYLKSSSVRPYIVKVIVTWMPQRKFFVATEIIVFDFKLFIGGRGQKQRADSDNNSHCRSFKRSSYHHIDSINLEFSLVIPELTVHFPRLKLRPQRRLSR
jgi:hypothetical protein